MTNKKTDAAYNRLCLLDIIEECVTIHQLSRIGVVQCSLSSNCPGNGSLDRFPVLALQTASAVFDMILSQWQPIRIMNIEFALQINYLRVHIFLSFWQRLICG